MIFVDDHGHAVGQDVLFHRQILGEKEAGGEPDDSEKTNHILYT